MNSDNPELPYKILGDRLKNLRQKLHESVADVSGAVEIDEQMLKRYELGQERPSEDILMLLINHFGAGDDTAADLWDLAGYDPDRCPSCGHEHDPEEDHPPKQQPQNNRSVVMIMAVDPRVIYSDGVQISANSSGVILNFSQNVGTPQAITTAKIGMSREQAMGLLSTLHSTLEASKPKQLPAAPAAIKSKSKDSKKK